MAWSYSGSPSDSDRDALRFTIGDTDTNDQQMTNEELDYLLATYTTVSAASIEAAVLLASKYARQVDKSVGDLRLSLSQRAEAYRQLAKDLRDRARVSGSAAPLVYAGGISRDDKDTRDDDTDRVPPRFARGQFTGLDERSLESVHGWIDD